MAHQLHRGHRRPQHAHHRLGKGYDGITDPISKEQITTLDKNMAQITPAAFFPFMHKRQGIVHVIGPENGATLPGMTVVCGDSHTSTTARLAHWPTASALRGRARDGHANPAGQEGQEHAGAGGWHAGPKGVTPKDVVLAIIGKIGTAGGTGYTIEFAGSAFRAMSMEGRMTVCNMAIEAGARAGLVAVDDKTIEYVKAAPCRPPAWNGIRPWRTGRRCTLTPTRSLTPWSSSTPPKSCRKSPGAPAPRWCWAWTPACPTPTRKKDATKRGAIERA